MKRRLLMLAAATAAALTIPISAANASSSSCAGAEATARAAGRSVGTPSYTRCVVRPRSDLKVRAYREVWVGDTRARVEVWVPIPG